MKIEDIKKILDSNEYSFLKEEIHLGSNIALLTTGGSYAYGTNTEGSDIDIRGFYLNSKEEILTMECNDKPFEHKGTDTVIYPFKQIIKLLSSCNPNTLEILGTKEEHVFKCNYAGKLLRDNSHMFLSQIAVNSFGGYATAQLRRLQNALARDNYPKREKEKHIMDSIKNQMISFQDRYRYIDSGITLEIGENEEIVMDINLKNYPLRDLKGMYSEMSNVIKEYEKLNHRNNKKDELHLNKHAMHLIRLLIMGSEILRGDGINTFREQEHELLMDIRNGKCVHGNDYSEVFDIVDKYDKEFQYAKRNTVLPDKPDFRAINEIVIEINRRIIG